MTKAYKLVGSGLEVEMKLKSMSKSEWEEIQRRLTWGSGEVYRHPDCVFGSATHKVYVDALTLRDAVKELLAKVKQLEDDNAELLRSILNGEY